METLKNYANKAKDQFVFTNELTARNVKGDNGWTYEVPIDGGSGWKFSPLSRGIVATAFLA